MALRVLYFQGRGRAEATRLALAYTGTEFTDDRKSFAELQPLKESMPYGQFPVMFVGDVPIAQSCSMLRYVARNCGGGKLMPADAVQAAVAESIVDQVADVAGAFYAAAFGAAEKEKAIAAFKADKVRSLFLFAAHLRCFLPAVFDCIHCGGACASHALSPHFASLHFSVPLPLCSCPR